MRALLLFLLLIQPLAAQQLVSLQQDPKVAKSGIGFAVFKQDKPAVWTALSEAMTGLNWRPQTMDSLSGVVFLQTDGSWGRTWGSNNIAVGRFTTKKITRWSTWQSLALQANLMVKTLEPHRTEVRLSISYSGCNGAQAMFSQYTSCLWEPLQTNGALEEEVLQRISARLSPLSAEELNPPSKADAAVVTSAKEQVTSFQKLLAAFELEAPPDQILSSLISAKASLDGFKESSESQPVPMFTASLVKAIQDFALANKSSGEEREAALKSAQTNFAEAKRCLATYQKHVQEVEPGSTTKLMTR